MSERKAVLHIDKVKSKAMMTKMFKHNFRTDFAENVDKSRSHLNEELVGLPECETYKTVFEKRFKSMEYYKTHTLRKDAVLGLDVLMSFSKEGGDESEPFDLEGWKQKSIQWLQDTYGKDNVVAAILHVDESVPHIHAFVIPEIEGRLCAKHFTNGPRALSVQQDSYHESVKEFGISRGTKKSTAKHSDVKEFYGALKEARSKELPPVIENETADDYRVRAQAVFKRTMLQHKGDIYKLKQKINENNGLSITEKIAINNSQEEIDRLDKENKRLKKELEKASRKSRRLDELAYACTHNIPSSEEAEKFQESMISISAMAREAMEREAEMDREAENQPKQKNI